MKKHETPIREKPKKFNVPARMFETQKEVTQAQEEPIWLTIPDSETKTKDGSEIRKMIVVDTWKALSKVGNSHRSREEKEEFFSSNETVMLKEKTIKLDSRLMSSSSGEHKEAVMFPM